MSLVKLGYTLPLLTKELPKGWVTAMCAYKKQKEEYMQEVFNPRNIAVNAAEIFFVQTGVKYHRKNFPRLQRIYHFNCFSELFEVHKQLFI